MNIVFMGTPEFAVPCLARLVDEGYNVSGVFTQPDKPKGRGHKVQFPPVKEYAVSKNIPVFQPNKMRDGEAMRIIEELNPDLIVVVAYGKILPSEILHYPKYGCINMHASLLPHYRGAAPIQWCVLNGESQTGVTAMQMNEGLDTGDMLLCQKTDISPNETAGELHDRLSAIGADVLSQTLEQLKNGELKPEKQDDSLSNYAPMLSKELCPINWTISAAEIHNQVRGLSPWPVATTKWNERKIKIHKTAPCTEKGRAAGEVIKSDNRLIVSCGENETIEILSLQIEGKKTMNSADFLRGNRIEAGTILK